MANYRERLLTDSLTGPSFSTARRKRSEDLSRIRETLNPRIPGTPWQTSFDVGGQRPICRTDASPTEDPSKPVDTARNGSRIHHLQDNAGTRRVLTKVLNFSSAWSRSSRGCIYYQKEMP